MTELWVSGTSADQNWRTVDFTFIAHDPLQLVWRAKRVLRNGAFGGGDLAVDDIKLSECLPDDISSTTAAPLLGLCAEIIQLRL